jgi:hypothetical protein
MANNSNTSRWLVLLNLILGFFSVGQVWLVQTVCYPLWAYVGQSSFPAYHIAWWHDIWAPIFIPCGLTLVGLIVLFKIRPTEVPISSVWLGLALQMALWGLTAAWWGRWMAELVQVSGPFYGHLYHLLLVTHWLRVAIVTAYGLLMLWMADRAFFKSNILNASYAT